MRIDFGASFGDLLKTSKPGPTFWLLTVCMLIPVVGAFVVTGYLFRRFARVRLGKHAEDFDFEHFADHLMFGVWPTLVSLVVLVAAAPLLVLPIIPFFFVQPIASEDVWLLLGIIGGSACVMLLLFLCIGLVSFPICLKSGLRLNFAAGFSPPFVAGFLRKVGLPLLGWSTLLFLILNVAMTLGSFAFYVGMYPVLTLYSFSWTHLLFQHYDLYLERGGEPIEFAPELVADFHRSPPPIPRTPPALPED